MADKEPVKYMLVISLTSSVHEKKYAARLYRYTGEYVEGAQPPWESRYCRTKWGAKQWGKFEIAEERNREKKRQRAKKEPEYYELS